MQQKMRKKYVAQNTEITFLKVLKSKKYYFKLLNMKQLYGVYSCQFSVRSWYVLIHSYTLFTDPTFNTA